MSRITETKTRVLQLNQFLDVESKDRPASYGQFEVLVPGPYNSIEEMEEANRRSGGHYFDKNAKRFFRSRINDEVIEGRFFVDSVQFKYRGERRARQYEIRVVHDDGRTSSVVARDSKGNWTEDFHSLDSARRAVRRLINE